MNTPTPEQRAEWRKLANKTMMISALGEYTPEEFTILLDAVDTMERELAETKQQRDTLAEALRYLVESCESIDCAALMPSSMPDSYDKAKKALATLKGEA